MSFLYHDVSLNIYYPDLKHPTEPTMIERVSNSNVEFSYGDPPQNGVYTVRSQIDIKESSISYYARGTESSQFLNSEFNGFVIRDIHHDLPRIVDVQLSHSGNTLHFDQSRVSFNENAIYADVSGLYYSQNKGFTLKVTFGIEGTNSSNSLIGTKSKDWLFGEGGNDKLSGNLGNDTLTGGAGKDTFFFNTKPSASNIDHIKDFRAVDDTIKLENSIFKALKAGGLHENEFAFIKSGKEVVDSDAHILYDKAHGALYYDPNGGSAGGRVEFAILDNHAALTYKDFLIV